jgi:hypothetical protein
VKGPVFPVALWLKKVITRDTEHHRFIQSTQANGIVGEKLNESAKQTTEFSPGWREAEPGDQWPLRIESPL